MENILSGIYKITSPSNKVYIGQSINIPKRINYYKNGHCKGQRKLYASILKYGPENHLFEIIQYCKKEELNAMEAHYIKLFDSFDTKHGLNLTSGGGVYEESEETRIKRSESLKGRVFTQEWKDKIGAKSKGRMLGFKHSEESIQKMKSWKRKKSDKPHPLKGTGMSKEEALIRHRLANVEYRKRQKVKKLQETVLSFDFK